MPNPGFFIAIVGKKNLKIPFLTPLQKKKKKGETIVFSFSNLKMANKLNTDKRAALQSEFDLFSSIKLDTDFLAVARVGTKILIIKLLRITFRTFYVFVQMY